MSALLFFLVSLLIFFLQYKQASTQLRQTINQQARAHINLLASGSIDDLLAKDYGVLENWVKATAESNQYAYAFILSADGTILLHSDLAMAGKQHAVPGIRDKNARQLVYKEQTISEIHQPIMIENTLIGTAHLAYYELDHKALVGELLLNYGLLYAIQYVLLMFIQLFVLLKFTHRTP